MNKTQAKQVLLAINALYLLNGAETVCVIDRLSDEDAKMFEKTQTEMALSMLKKAGFNNIPTVEDVLIKVLNKPSSTITKIKELNNETSIC